MNQLNNLLYPVVEYKVLSFNKSKIEIDNNKFSYSTIEPHLQYINYTLNLYQADDSSEFFQWQFIRDSAGKELFFCISSLGIKIHESMPTELLLLLLQAE